MTKSDSSSFEFADYGEILRRRWRLVVVGLLAGIVLAGLALVLVPKTYTSTASVIVQSTVDDTSVDNSRTNSAINLDTEAQIVTSGIVAKLGQVSLGVKTDPRELAKDVKVTVPANTSVLNIAYTASSATAAQKGARAFARAYLENRKAVAQRATEAELTTLSAKTQGRQAELNATTRRIASLSPNAPQMTRETAQRDLLVQQIAALKTQMTTLDSAEITPGNIITDAHLPTVPSNPNPKLLVASGLLAGLLAGLLLAFVVDRADKRVRDRRDLERLGLDTLVGRVRVPAVRDGVSGPGAAEGAESLRQLRNALLAQMPINGGSVLVASASPGPSGSAVAVSLAMAIAKSGCTVILVSANSEECAVSNAFSMPEYPGLADLLTGRADIDEALRQVSGHRNLRVMTAGAEGPRYSDLLQSANAQKVFGRLHEQAEYVVVDVAPISFNTDAQTLASSTGGVLLVATSLKTKRGELLEAVDQLNHVSAGMFGSIIVSVNREQERPADRDEWRYAAGDRSGGQDGVADADDDIEPAEVDDHDSEVARIVKRH